MKNKKFILLITLSVLLINELVPIYAESVVVPNDSLFSKDASLNSYIVNPSTVIKSDSKNSHKCDTHVNKTIDSKSLDFYNYDINVDLRNSNYELYEEEDDTENYPITIDSIYKNVYCDELLSRFKYDGNSIIYCFFKVSIYNKAKANKSKQGDIKIKFVKYDEYYDEDDEYYNEDDEYEWCVNDNSNRTTIETAKCADGYSCWFLYDLKKLKKGKGYGIIVFNNSDYKYTIEGFVRKYNKYSKNISINKGKSISQKAGYKYGFYTLKSIDKTSLPYIKSVKSSNVNIAKGFGYGHKLVVYAKKPGKCTLTVKLKSGATTKVKVKVKNGKPILNSTYYDLLTKQKRKNAILFNNKKVKWSSTNKKVATVNSKGKITARSAGSCTIKARVAGKTLKCKVDVGNPDFWSELISYNTRSNTFYVKIKNHGTRNITIYSNKAIAKDKDYKSFDRKLKLKNGKSSIVVKAKKSKTIGFKVIGSTTWYKVDDFNLYFYFKYDGKIRKCWVDHYDCGGYLNGKSWIYTEKGWE